MLKSAHYKDITKLSMTFPNAMPSYWDKIFYQTSETLL